MIRKILKYLKFDPFIRIPEYKRHIRLHLTLGRILNYYLSKLEMILGQTHLKSKPWGIDVEPIRACNLACTSCPMSIETYSRETLSLQRFREVIEPIAKNLLMVDFSYWGEPVLNPELGKMIAYAKDRKIATIVRANLNLLSDTLAEDLVDTQCDILLVGMDTATQETYERYRRNGKVDAVRKNLEKIQKLKKQKKSLFPKILFYSVVTQYNVNEKNRLEEFSRQVGGIGVYYTPVVLDFHLTRDQDVLAVNDFREQAIQLAPLPVEEKLYTVEGEKVTRLNQTKSCWMAYMYPALSANGLLNSCWHVFHEEDALVGRNRANYSFQEVWNGEKAQAIRKYLSTRQTTEGIEIPCVRCSSIQRSIANVN